MMDTADLIIGVFLFFALVGMVFCMVLLGEWLEEFYRILWEAGIR